MQFRNSTYPLQLRFRRWSRNAWSVFISLGRVVTIGSLRTGIADQSQVKQHLLTEQLSTCRFDELLQDEDLNAEIRLNEIELIPVTVTVPTGAGYSGNEVDDISGWYGFRRTNRFLFVYTTMFTNLIYL